jgi:hypothetical protein
MRLGSLRRPRMLRARIAGEGRLQLPQRLQARMMLLPRHAPTWRPLDQIRRKPLICRDRSEPVPLPRPTGILPNDRPGDILPRDA